MSVRVFVVQVGILPELPEQDVITAENVLKAAKIEFNPETQILINENDGKIEPDQEIGKDDRIFVVPKEEEDDKDEDGDVDDEEDVQEDDAIEAEEVAEQDEDKEV